jgi:hypothetical protein
MKKLLFAVIIITVVPVLFIQLVSALQPPPPWGWDARKSGDFYFQPLPCGTIEVWYDGPESIVVIPSKIEGYIISRIGAGVISHRPNPGGRFGKTKIFVIPESVTSIDDVSFDYENAKFRREYYNAVDNIIYGYTGSLAEDFANAADILFIPLDVEFPFTMLVLGNLLEFDEPPFIDEGVVFVPLRGFFENIGRIYPTVEARTIIWDSKTQTVTIELYDWFNLPPALFETVEVAIGSDTFSIDGNTLRGSLSHNQLQTDIFEIEAPPRMVNSRVFVPISYFLDFFGFVADYDSYYRVFDIGRNPDPRNITYARFINEIRPR